MPPVPNIGLRVRDYFASAITGGDGNREFFVWIAPHISDPLHSVSP